MCEFLNNIQSKFLIIIVVMRLISLDLMIE